MISDAARNAFVLLAEPKGLSVYPKRFSAFKYMLALHHPSGEQNAIDTTGVVDCNQYSCSKLYSRIAVKDSIVTTYMSFSDTTGALMAQHAISHFFEELFKYNIKTYAFDRIVYFSFPISLFNGHWYMHNFLLKYLRLGLAYCTSRGGTNIPSLSSLANNCYDYFHGLLGKPESKLRYEFFQYGNDGDQFLRLRDKYNYLMSIPFEKWTFNDRVFSGDDGMRASFMNYLELENTNFHKQYKNAGSVAASKP